MTHRIVIPLAVAFGVLAALATSARGATPTTPAAPAVPPPIAAVTPALPAAACRVPSAEPAPAAAPASLRDHFAILRRERTPADALPSRALAALRRAGVTVPDAGSARLLRQSPDRGRAWVIPVADVAPLLRPALVCAALPPRRPRRAAAPRLPRPAAAQRRAVPAQTTPAAPAPLPVPRTPAPLPAAKPRPGLVVVAIGDVPGGGGGALTALLRGVATPSVAPCAGPRHDLVGVSGVVPDGVGAVYLTGSDGSAVRADVQDNGYAFLVAPPAGRAGGAERYVVWTGQDGTPHVRSVLLPRVPSRICGAAARARARRLTFSPQATPVLGMPIVAAPVVLPPPQLPAPVSPARAPKHP